MSLNLLINDFIKRLKTDFAFRTIITGIMTLIGSLFMFVFNLLIGIDNDANWNISISVFYLVLFLIRLLVLVFEFFIKKSKNPRELELKSYRIVSYLLIIINLSIVVPILMLSSKQKAAYVNNTVAIIFALYTTVKFGFAIRNMFKTKNNYSLTIRLLKIISFTAALFSLMNLESVLILTFGKYDPEMTLFSTVTNIVIFTYINFMTIITIINGYKLNKKYKDLNLDLN